MEFEHKHRKIIPGKCPVCDADQDELTSVPVGQSEDRMIMHVTCTKCDNALMVFVTHNDVGMMTFGIMVDVYGPEAQVLFSKKPVNDDDVINMHRYLQKEDVSINDFVEA